MAKDLHWFKFIITEWTHGDIVLCSLPAQGLFVNIMALYWAKECDLTIKKMRKHFPAAMRKDSLGMEKDSEIFAELVEEGVVKIDGDKIRISFMDEQKATWYELSAVKSEAGKLGGRGNKKADRKARDKADGKQTEKQNESTPESKTKAGHKAKQSYREGDKTSLPERAEGSRYPSVPNRDTSTAQTSPGLASGIASSNPKTIETRESFFADIEGYKFKRAELAEMAEGFNYIPDDQVLAMYLQFRRTWKTEEGQKKTPKADDLMDLIIAYSRLENDNT